MALCLSLRDTVCYDAGPRLRVRIGIFEFRCFYVEKQKKKEYARSSKVNEYFRHCERMCFLLDLTTEIFRSIIKQQISNILFNL